MITLTRLNGRPFVVNAELIRTIEERPDTTIVLVNGDTFIVKEKMQEVVARAVEYAGTHEDNILVPLGSGFYGYMNRDYKARDVCPFE